MTPPIADLLRCPTRSRHPIEWSRDDAPRFEAMPALGRGARSSISPPLRRKRAWQPAPSMLASNGVPLCVLRPVNTNSLANSLSGTPPLSACRSLAPLKLAHKKPSPLGQAAGKKVSVPLAVPLAKAHNLAVQRLVELEEFRKEIQPWLVTAPRSPAWRRRRCFSVDIPADDPAPVHLPPIARAARPFSSPASPSKRPSLKHSGRVWMEA